MMQSHGCKAARPTRQHTAAVAAPTGGAKAGERSIDDRIEVNVFFEALINHICFTIYIKLVIQV